MFLFLICAALPGATDTQSFPSPVVGHVTTDRGEGLMAACGVAVKITAKQLHLAEEVHPRELQLPRYPESLYNQGVTGQCEILFKLQNDGSLRDIRPGRATQSELSDAALKVVKLWKFAPIKQFGNRGEIAASATFVFMIFSERLAD
jgi:TonB family protein